MGESANERLFSRRSREFFGMSSSRQAAMGVDEADLFAGEEQADVGGGVVASFGQENVEGIEAAARAARSSQALVRRMNAVDDVGRGEIPHGHVAEGDGRGVGVGGEFGEVVGKGRALSTLPVRRGVRARVARVKDCDLGFLEVVFHHAAAEGELQDAGATMLDDTSPRAA